MAAIAALLVRCGLVLLFLPFSAIDKIWGFRHALAQARQVVRPRVPAAIMLLAGLAIEIVCSLGVVTGIADRAAAFVVAGYCAATAILFKRFWAQGDFWADAQGKGRGLFWDFVKNLSLGAGFPTDRRGHRRIGTRVVPGTPPRLQPALWRCVVSDDDPSAGTIWRAITAFRLVTQDADRLVHFYAALGFAVGDRRAIASDEMAMLGLSGGGFRRSMMLGDQCVDLDQFAESGRRYPVDADAADLVFQHLALVTRDPAAAWARALAVGATPIGRGGPVTLPPATGGVTAVKFRDPDGHPLELLSFPADDGRGAGATRGGVERIDHSAIVTAEADAGIAFYSGHGLAAGPETLNEGPTQVALDGLDGVRVRVVPLRPGVPTPHLELLGYRRPVPARHASGAANDIAATRLVWDGGHRGLARDPDGHLHHY